jgi:hypothetical protein
MAAWSSDTWFKGSPGGVCVLGFQMMKATKTFAEEID